MGPAHICSLHIYYDFQFSVFMIFLNVEMVGFWFLSLLLGLFSFCWFVLSNFDRIVFGLSYKRKKEKKGSNMFSLQSLHMKSMGREGRACIVLWAQMQHFRREWLFRTWKQHIDYLSQMGSITFKFIQLIILTVKKEIFPSL